MEKSDTLTAGPSVEKTLMVLNKTGIHARPAAMIVRITNRFKCDVQVRVDDVTVNGKSIMGLMMLAAGKGSKVRFSATGNDSDTCMAEIEQLFNRKFDEP